MTSNGDIDINYWSKERSIGNYDNFDLVYVGSDIDIDTGNIRNDRSIDLLY